MKEKIEGLLEVGFIKLIRYDEWISIIVQILNKNGNLRISIAFRSIKIITLKDEYPISLINMLINTTLINEIYVQLYEWSL